MASIVCPGCGRPNRADARFCDGCAAPLAGPEAVEPGLPGPFGEGRFVPTQLLGEGARKRVYLARDERLGREVALAIVKTEGLDRAARARLAREARAMARLGDDPRVVTVFDVGEEPDGTPYIVSQYMPGGSLADRLQAADEGRLPVGGALELAEQIAWALAHAHGHGIVHRDLKPGNVWLAADGTARLGDFGLAAPLDASRVTSEGMLVGTVAYLAPEQALGRDPDPRADLYALGAVLYEMLCGRPPFLGDDAVAVVSQHLHTAPVVPSWHRAEVGPELDELVLALLAKDPGQRPATAEAVATRLAESRAASPSGPESVEVERPAPVDLRRADWGRFVGRADEMAQLRVVLDDALAGRTRLAMVVGEPGIGKTRLVEELGAYASMRGAQVIWGHCYEGEVGFPYLPWVEAFRSYVRTGGAKDLTTTSGGLPEVATILPELRERYPELPTLPPLDDEAERLRLFEGVASFLRSAATAQPLVVVLDDLHWADQPSLLLLQHMVRSMTGERLLLVGTYRDVELDRHHPLAEAMVNLRRHRAYERVLLRGLGRDEVKALVEAIGGQAVGDAFPNLLFRETEGNPFFVAEILRHLFETGAIRREAGTFVGAPDSIASALPEGVREVIGRRLDRLSENCNEMLTIAAAMPGGFTIDVIGRVIDRREDEMLDLLDEALAAQVVRERPDHEATYEFAHALIRQTLYGELATPRRVRVHRRVLAALEDEFAGRLDAHLAELAYHAYQAAPGGDVAKAVDYATRAGDTAMERVAYEEAVRSYEMALQALEHDPALDRAPAELWLRLGRARHRAGDGVGGRAACLEAATAARRRGDPVALAQAAIDYPGPGLVGASSGLDETWIELCEEASAALQAHRDSPLHLDLLARVLAAHAMHAFLEDPERAKVLAEEALAVAGRSGQADARASAARAALTAGLGASHLEELRDLVDEIDSEDHRAAIMSSLSYGAWLVGDRDEYEHWGDRAAELAARTRAPARLMATVQTRGFRAALDGHFEEAERLYLSTLESAHKLQNNALVTGVGIGLWPVYREQGRLAEFEGPTRALADRPDALSAWRVGIAHNLAEDGNLDEALTRVRAVIGADGTDFGSDPSGPYLLAALGDIAWRGQAPDVAAAALKLGQRPDMPVVCSGGVGFYGAADRARGLAYEVLGQPDEAVARHQEALALHQRLRAPVWTGRSQFDLARALQQRGGDGDADEAVRLVNRAIETATHFGATRLLDEALALKLAIQGISSTSSPALSIDAVSASITMDRPDLRGYAAPDGHITFCFTDIVGYSSITDRLGDARTHELLKAHNTMLRHTLQQHHGHEVKSQGDGFMLVFADPDDALRFAMGLQQAVADHAWDPQIAPLQVRIGVHRGEAIRDHQDFFGRAVIVGARIAADAGGGETLVSDQVRAAAAGFQYGEPRALHLKGMSEAQMVHPLRR
jgi:class 3 adenylate cyclase/tetratricopeptide (TPR) repeat protein